MRRALAALAAVLLALTACSSTPAKHERLPDTVLSAFSSSGKPLELGTLKGPVVVNLWASWCAPCRRDLPFYEAYVRQAGHVRVIGVDYKERSTAKARTLISSTGVTYPLYSDPHAALGARALPAVLFVDAHGVVVHREYVEITSVKQLDRLVEKHLKVPA